MLIGIDKYKNTNQVNSLDFAAADARALKKTLIEAAGVPEQNITLLVSDAPEGGVGGSGAEARPERNTILRELARLSKSVQPGDTVYVFFSGHGIEVGGASYLLPFDADGFNTDTLTDTAIDTTRFRERLQNVHAGLLFLAFDMCRNNPIKGSRDAVAANTLKSSQVRGLDFAGIAATGGAAPSTAVDGPHAVVTLFSCSPEERSYEWTARQRGYFSYFLEQGLRGAPGATASDGSVHIDTLTRYLTRSVTEAVRAGESAVQTPFAEVRGQIDASRLALAPTPGSTAAAPVAVASATTDPRAYLNVAVAPEEATVLIDGVAQKPVSGGHSGRIAIDLKGEATRVVEIGITAPGYLPKVESVTLQRGVAIPLAVVLQPGGSGTGAATTPHAATTSVPAAAVTPPAETKINLLPPPLSLGGKTPVPGSVRINPKDGAEMVYVPGGPFPMGDDDIADNKRHIANVSGFYIYKNLVTVEMYRAFCDATGHEIPAEASVGGLQGDHPIVGITWDEACAYCAWAGSRLPTEAEWEKAARGTDGRKFPWGNEYDPNKLWQSRATFGDAGGSHAVGGYPAGASPYGALDMAGNTWEWCADYYDKDFGTSSRASELNPVNDTPTNRRTIRGGSWYYFDQICFRTANRGSDPADWRGISGGFRCAVSVAP